MFAYWFNEKIVSIFKNNKTIKDYYDARNGITTGNNELFLRFWFEVENNNICYGATDFINALYFGKKWFPYNKGGDYRKWYGNQECIIDWECNGKRIKEYGHLVPRSMAYMFIESISWSKISSGNVSFRIFQKGFMFDVAGLSMFASDETLSKYYCSAFLNCIVSTYYLKAMSPTLNYESVQIGNLPVVINQKYMTRINVKVEENIIKSKNDWDSFETSWDFKKHPLI